MAKKSEKNRKSTKGEGTSATARKVPFKPRKNPEDVKNKIVAFRLTDDQHKEVQESIDKNPMMGVISASDLSRKLLADYLAGRVVFKKKKWAERDYDKYPEKLLQS